MDYRGRITIEPGKRSGVNAGEGAPHWASPPRLFLDQNLAPAIRFARANP
jgi:hypothetical protein